MSQSRDRSAAALDALRITLRRDPPRGESPARTSCLICGQPACGERGAVQPKTPETTVGRRL